MGYLEKDPVRGDDSFRAFEEVLALAKSNRVDMLLLAGDLFHDNKPSRATLVRTMKMLRAACMSPDGSVHLAVRSDPTIVNYMNPCVAISLPVFIIHGNHDDPTGGAGLDALSAIDLLEQAGLVTYFGRTETSTKIDVAPVLLEKGQTRLALYGLGNIRDEVLYNTWMTERKLRWLSPQTADQPDNSNNSLPPWFNLFVLHQNRYTRGSAKGISETLLPPWLDYVVWGHEHDSIPDVSLSEPPITQPGSTVATSLTAGEAKPKHAVLLEVYKGKLKHRPVPLHLPRHFQFEDVILSEQKDLSDTDPKQLNEFLRRMVEEMIKEQETAFEKKLHRFQTTTSTRTIDNVVYPDHSFYTERLTNLVRQPLVRLRVEITGNWEPPNPQRFGQEYVGRSACPADIILYYRNRRRPLKRTRPFLQGHGGEQGASQDPDAEIASMSQDDTGNQSSVQIPTLVKYYLYHRQAGGTGLKFLELDKLTNAVDQFVNKELNQAIPEYVKSYLKVQQDKTLNAASDTQDWNEKELLEKFENQANLAATKVLEGGQEVLEKPTTESTAAKKGSRVATAENDSAQNDVAAADPPQAPTLQDQLEDVHALLAANPKIAATTARVIKEVNDDDDDDDDDDEAAAAPRKSRAKPTTRGRGRGRKTAVAPRRTATQNSSRSRTPTSTTRPRRTANKVVEIVEDSDEENDLPVGTPREDIVIEDSEEEYVPVANTRKRRAPGTASGSRSRSSARARTDSQGGSGRSAFANRARPRRAPATIDVDEESGDDAM